MSEQDTPVYAQQEQYRIPVNDYPAAQTPIPPSRMFEIKKALDGYKAKMGADAPVYDASQGDGGASLPGVPADILMRAAEMQVTLCREMAGGARLRARELLPPCASALHIRVACCI